LAECYGHYGLALNALAPIKDPTPTGAAPDDLKTNLEKAYSLLEFADEIMTGDGECQLDLSLLS
jgi:hypothetical protein